MGSIQFDCQRQQSLHLVSLPNMLLIEILTSFSSGEVHYQRMPVPEMWLDIFHKFKANGLNTIRYVASRV